MVRRRHASAGWLIVFGLLCMGLLALGCAQSVLPETDTGVVADLGTSADVGVDGSTEDEPLFECIDNDGDQYGVGPHCLGTDCDDRNRDVHDMCTTCVDVDEDGYGEGCARGTDCEDGDPYVNPGRPEVPGNGKDDDCVGGDLDCVDEDGDGYGIGSQCRGLDCLEGDREVNPDAREICDNGKDDDCMDGDAVCPEDCIDVDHDGYGVGADCLGLDCNDDVPSANPMGTEICNDIDDDCDDETDECPQAGYECDPVRRSCRAGLGVSCGSAGDCLRNLTCDLNLCRGVEGASCDSLEDCARGFLCNSGTGLCTVDPDYNVCDDLGCESGCGDDEGLCCLQIEARCVGCLDHYDCPDVEICAGYGCFDTTWRDVSEDAAAVKEMAQWMADCFHLATDTGSVLCGLIDASSLAHSLTRDEVLDWICDDAVDGDFIGGERDHDAARGVAGCGLFNDKDVNWGSAIPAGSFWEFCMWTLPPKSDNDEQDVSIGPCEDYPIDE